MTHRILLAAATLLAASLTTISARQPAAVAVDGDDIGGVVRSSKGAEAGVWVIAETKDLPTPYVKIVVTDDQGRYLLPDLPKANYSRVRARLWSRRFAHASARRRARR